MSENGTTEPVETDANKLFVGGLSWETSEEKLQDYFSDYGDVAHCMIMMNRETGKSRGFGFVTFKSADAVKMVLAVPQHSIDNRVIDPKVCAVKSARPKKAEEPPVEKHEEKEFGKIFLGGLPADINESGLKEFFSEYGKVTEVIIMYDQEKKRPRGFGFLTFDSDEPVNKLVANKYITIRGKQVEVKKASPQGSNKQYNNGGPRGGYGYGPGGFGTDGNHNQGYNNSYNGQQGPGGPPGGPNAQMPPNMYGYPPMWGAWPGMPPMGAMPPNGAPGPWGAPPGQPPMGWPGYGYPGPWGMPPPGMYGMPPSQVPPPPGQQAPPPAPVGQPGQQPPQQPTQPGQGAVPPANYPSNYYGQPPQQGQPAAGQAKPENDGYGQAFNPASGDSGSAGAYSQPQPNSQTSSNGGYGGSQDSNYNGKPNGSGDNYYANYPPQYPPANGPRHASTHHDAQQAQFGTRSSSSYHPYRRP